MFWQILMSHRLHYPVQQKSLKANSFLMLRLKKRQLLETISIQTFLTHQRSWSESSRRWKIGKKKKAGLGSMYPVLLVLIVAI